MITKKLLGLCLVFAMAAASSAATTTGIVKGQVSIAGRGVAGLPLTLVNVETGRSFSVNTAGDGSFEAALPAGSYVFSSPGRSGIAIARAPLSVDVASGKTASAMIEMAVLAVQASSGAGRTGNILHDPVDCIAFDRFTMIEAGFEPLTSVVNGRLYFQSNLSPEWFYTQFELIQPKVAGGPTHRAFIPKVVAGGGITTINYYAQITSSDFAETRSTEKAARVVDGAGSCDGKLAPFGTPSGPVSVFSASGSAVGGVAGFAGAAGGGLGTGTIALIAGVVAGAGVGINELTNESRPTPIPATGLNPTTATPAPPAPPVPVPVCAISISTSPDAPGGNWGPTGSGPVSDPVLYGSQPRYCQVFIDVNGAPAAGSPVSGSATIPVACNARVTLTASVAPVTSKVGPLPASWSQDCSGSALGVPCTFAPVAANRAVGLTCATR